MNIERIAEIEAAFGEETLMAVIDFADVAELCRLARLGLRVEGAPNRLALFSGTGLDHDPLVCRINNIVPDDWEGKRVALVVLEDAN